MVVEAIVVGDRVGWEGEGGATWDSPNNNNNNLIIWGLPTFK